MSEERNPAAREQAREAGAAALSALRRAAARKAAELIRNDPDDAAAAVELGLVDQAWLEHPGEGQPISSSAPTEVLRRFLERSVERRPSKLSSLGLTAIQLLSSGSDESTVSEGAPSSLTIVFTDLEGFTAFTDRYGDAAAIEVITAHHAMAEPVIRQWRGRLVKHLGDGLLCTFPDPHAGVHAALALLATAPPPLRLRAGVHTGDAVVTKQDVVGHVVNVTARVCEAAKGGQVLVSADVVSALGSAPSSDGVRFGRVKNRRMKGVQTPVGVAEAIAG
jgi:adenylate cyclase